MYLQYNSGKLVNYSMMDRLEMSFEGVSQHNGKLRMLIDYKAGKATESQLQQEYLW